MGIGKEKPKRKGLEPQCLLLSFTLHILRFTFPCSTQAGEQATLHVGFQEAFRSKPNSQLKFLQEVELIHHLDFYLIAFANEQSVEPL